jgi:septum formation protein
MSDLEIKGRNWITCLNTIAKLILGSVSPRRKELMSLGGWVFDIMPADVDENILQNENAREYVLRIAEDKARAVSRSVPDGSLVIAADTTVVDPEGTILAKPMHEVEAHQMLDRLRGRVHQVLTGVVVLHTSNDLTQRDVCATEVRMRSYSDQEILAYIQSGDPFDKAGGYAIQHAGFHPVEEINGCYANVVGLPVCTLARLLETFGVQTAVQVPKDCLPTQDTPCSICKQLDNNL